MDQVFITPHNPELDGDSDEDSGDEDGGSVQTFLEEVFSELIPLKFSQMEEQ